MYAHAFVVLGGVSVRVGRGNWTAPYGWEDRPVKMHSQSRRTIRRISQPQHGLCEVTVRCHVSSFPLSSSLMLNSLFLRRPSYSWGVSIGDQTGRVVPCRRDGYTRINALPLPVPTAVPVARTALPNAFPTIEPSEEPTATPSLTEMCCEFTSYAPESNW
jgi:hypothetical protein